MRCCWTKLAAATIQRNAPKKTSFVETSTKIQLDATKAGLSGVNKAHVNKVIEKISKGSAFYLNEQRKETQRETRNMELLLKFREYRNISAAAKHKLREKVEMCEVDLEAGRQFGNYIHVDMDMFYAAVEMKKNPSLVDVPLGVGSMEMLSTTNYVARRYGVRSGMPGYIGVKLCPALVIVPADFDAYRAEAAVVRAIAADYDPRFASVGLDELTMEVTAYLRRHPGTAAADVAAEFRARVFSATRLTASAGIGPTATLSKIASNYKKPDGQHELRLGTREEVIEFMKDLPVRTVPGIGPVQEKTLHALGIRTCGSLLRQKEKLCFVFPEKTFRFYLSAGLGVMCSTSEPRRGDKRQKSIGHETTFKRRPKSEAELQEVLLGLLRETHKDLLLRREGTKHITLHMKQRSFEGHQYSVTLGVATNDFGVLWEETQKLLQPHLACFDNFRLVGVRLGKLQRISQPIPVEKKKDKSSPTYSTSRILSAERNPKARAANVPLLRSPSMKMRSMVMSI